jgi:hypothetical protein
MYSRSRFVVASLCFVGITAVRLVADDVQKKVAAPTDVQLKEADATISELFESQISSHDKGLAKKLLGVAQETKIDDVGRYALLRKAIDVGVAVLDSESTYAALDEMEKSYNLNVLPIWVGALDGLSKKVDVSARAAIVIDKAYDADDFDSAVKLANLVLTSAKNSKDISAVKNATAKLNEATAAREGFKKSAEARATLKKNPDDPESNRIVGLFLCLTKKDWDKGLPLLAKGDAPALKKAAELDLEGKNQVAIGDAWNAIKGGQSRALYWYRKALPDLSGFKRARVAKLVKDLSPQPQWVDITSKIDPDKSTISGKWRRAKDGIIGHTNDEGQILLPIVLEKKYQLEFALTRFSPGGEINAPTPVGEINAIIPVGDYHCMVVLHCGNGAASGIQWINGKNVLQDSPASVKPGAIESNRKYILHISVAPEGDENVTIAVDLDGKPYTKYHGPIGSLTSGWHVPEKGEATLDCLKADVLFQKIRVFQ